MERWTPIEGYEGRYEVSDLGRVRSLPRKFQPAGRTLRLRTHRDGFSFKHISAVCRGQRQRHGGFQWRFE